MIVFISILLITFLATTLCTPIAIKISYKTDFLDHPTEDPLKIHQTTTPLLGGLAIFSGLLVAFLMGAIFFSELQKEIIGLVASLLILFLIGLIDDYQGLRPVIRLLGQLVASLIIVFFSVFQVNLISVQSINLAIIIFCLMGVTNAVNLIDGMDGLASGITFIASAGFLTGFILSENSLGIIISLGLIGVSIGFLLYNFPPAKIFLGDNGSTVLGFLLGILAVLYSSNSGSIRGFSFPILILLVPILDMCLAIGRRIIKGLPLFYGDRDHLYDQFVKKGWSQRQTMFVMCLVGLLGSIAGIVLIVL